MHRRELLQRSALVIGGSLLGADGLLARNINWEAMEDEEYASGIGIFDKAQIKLMNEVADTILPTTALAPGAKAAKVGQFMAVIVSDCYEADDQKRFVDGLLRLDEEAKSRHGKPFLKLKGSMRTDLLNELDREQRAFHVGLKAGTPPHYFRKIKDLTLWGYFTSEIGATKALRFVEYPGKHTTIAYQKGDRAFGGY